jgi:hypothetical protein
MTDLQIPRDGESLELKPLPDYDLARLTEDELEFLEQLLKKAAGQLAGDETPLFRIERVFVDGNTSENDADAHR